MADDNWGAHVGYDDGATGIWGIRNMGNDQQWFSPPAYRTDKQFTIVMLKPWVMNQQRHHISALADQFRNARRVLEELETTVRAQSQQMITDIWTKGVARDEFMKRGPGLALAYIQNWKEQVLYNELGLRSLLTPIETSQGKMEVLWGQYEAAVKYAGDEGNLSLMQKGDITDPNWHDELNPFSMLDNDAQIAQFLMKRVQAVKEEYDQKARDIVADLATAYNGAFSDVARGTGVQYEPPNVVMSPPGQELPPIPAGPGGAPTFNGLPGTANVQALPVPPGLNSQQLQQLNNSVPNVTQPPTNLPGGPPGTGPGALPGGVPVNPPGMQAAKMPGAFPGAVPPGFGILPKNGAMPAALPSGLPGGAPGAGNGVTPGQFGNGALPPPGLGRGLSNGVLRNPGGARGLSAMPPPGGGLGKRKRDSTLRSPAGYTSTAHAAGGPGGSPSGLVPPPGAGAGSRREASRGVPTVRTSGIRGVPEEFTRGSGSMPPPVSPVLGRQNRQGRRGSETPGVPPIAARGAFTPPTAAPPVLNASTSRSAGSMLPPPGGISPQQRRRGRQMPTMPAGAPGGPGGPGQPGMPFPPGGASSGRRQAGRYTGRQAPNLVGNPDWLVETTTDEVASTAPVLRNQVTVGPEGWLDPGMMAPVQPGATPSVVGRSPAAVRRAAEANRTRPPQNEAEQQLSRRAREADHRGLPAETREVRAGEEAFTVQTPGGSVVGGSGPSQPEEAPRPTIGNS